MCPRAKDFPSSERDALMAVRVPGSRSCKGQALGAQLTAEVFQGTRRSP